MLKRSSVLAICRALEARYGSPRHGNKTDPLDELVYIILSNRTPDRSFRSTFSRLKATYPSWRHVTNRRRGELQRILASGGLATLKTAQLLAIFNALRAAFGCPTLAPIRHLPDDEAEAFLTSLPGVGRKVAKCVLMYSLGRSVLPVDVHVHRVAGRLGMPVKRRPDTSQDLIEANVPPRLRYSFHVNVVAHGRALCRPTRPLCGVCPVQRYCMYYGERTLRA
jgi:endonuclease III